MKDCPQCRLSNPDTALRCDCGYDFASGTTKQSYVTTTEKHTARLAVMSRRLLLGLLILIAGAFCTLVWAIMVPHTPALTPDDAAKEISSTPQFNRHYSDLLVTSTLRAPKSQKDSMYFAELTFKANGATSLLHGHAIFQWESGWHLLSLRYGEPTNEVVIK